MKAVGVLFLELKALIAREGVVTPALRPSAAQSDDLVAQIPDIVVGRLTDYPGDPGWDRIFRIPWIPSRQD